MNQEPKRLLQDAAIDPSLRSELAAFGDHCATQPFDLQAGLARFESTLATAAPVAATTTAAAGATAGKGLSALLGAKGLAWATGALLSAGAVTWSAWPESSSEPSAAQSARMDSPVKSAPALTPAVDPPNNDAKTALPQPGNNSALQAELRVVKEARRALAQGRGAKALSILEAAQDRFSQGALVPERQALRIIALFKTGKRSKARRLARGFLAKHPQSPMAAKVRRMIRGASR